MNDSVECLAEVSFNQNKLAQIVAPVEGIIQTVDADLGARVEAGQTVARLWSATIAEAVAQAVLAHQTLEREQKLRAERITAEKDLQQAEAIHRAACQQLRTLGFTEEQIEELRRKPSEAVLMDLRAPFTGEIVQRTAVPGALAEAGQPLFVITDCTVMWADLSIPETALGGVRVGQPVELIVDALPDRQFTGELTWISMAVDERTRMARARAEFSNSDGALRDKMFARAYIVTRTTTDALLVPVSAIQHVDGKPLVFVKLDRDLFEAQAVQLGARDHDRHEVLAGLTLRDEIAVRQAFALKSHLLISRLGVGCVDE